ncbi:MAG: glycolate oxidase subunit GlcF [Rhodoferax sp.]|nr:glycolate oxidase subunit GlcF [Rhodoferax sp.]
MQTHLAPEYQHSADALAAKAILQKCVHCGFCTATCPTYQLLGDELDGPRGRIYLMKQVLEGDTPSRATQLHLDRCLTCRNCETTCPSGVDYGHLLDIGRKLVDVKVARPITEKAVRWLLKEGLPSPLFAAALRVGQVLRPLLPRVLQNKLPQRQPTTRPIPWPTTRHPRKVILLNGCTQPAMRPNIDSATARVLDAAGIECLLVAKSGCCGAVKFHLNDQDGGKAQMRANIDAWWPLLAPDARSGVDAIVMNASGCGITVKDYGHILRHDPAYADKAAHISTLTRDLSELLPELVPTLLPVLLARRKAKAALPALVFHPPCTLQHGQQLRGGVEQHLAALGFAVRLATNESHLCCGSAGTYSILNPGIANTLRDRKLQNLQARAGEVIISANFGCITHLQSGTDTPVRHWVEVVDGVLGGTG